MRSCSRQPTSRARVDTVRDREAARGQDTRPRSDRVPIVLHRPPGTRGPAHRPLRQSRRPGERHGRGRLRLQHPRGYERHRPGSDLGQTRGSRAGRGHRERLASTSAAEPPDLVCSALSIPRADHRLELRARFALETFWQHDPAILMSGNVESSEQSFSHAQWREGAANVHTADRNPSRGALQQR
jgi:hypothetical protein